MIPDYLLRSLEGVEDAIVEVRDKQQYGIGVPLVRHALTGLTFDELLDVRRSLQLQIIEASKEVKP